MIGQFTSKDHATAACYKDFYWDWCTGYIGQMNGCLKGGLRCRSLVQDWSKDRAELDVSATGNWEVAPAALSHWFHWLKWPTSLCYLDESLTTEKWATGIFPVNLTSLISEHLFNPKSEQTGTVSKSRDTLSCGRLTLCVCVFAYECTQRCSRGTLKGDHRITVIVSVPQVL